MKIGKIVTVALIVILAFGLGIMFYGFVPRAGSSMERAIEKLKNPIETIALEGDNELRQFPRDAVVPRLKLELQTKDNFYLFKVIAVLRKLGEDKNIPVASKMQAFLGAFDSNLEEVKVLPMLADAIMVNPPEAASYLETPNNAHRRLLIKAFGAVGHTAAPFLVSRFVPETDAESRILILQNLTALRSPFIRELKSLLINLLNDPSALGITAATALDSAEIFDSKIFEKLCLSTAVNFEQANYRDLLLTQLRRLTGPQIAALVKTCATAPEHNLAKALPFLEQSDKMPAFLSALDEDALREVIQILAGNQIGWETLEQNISDRERRASFLRDVVKSMLNKTPLLSFVEKIGNPNFRARAVLSDARTPSAALIPQLIRLLDNDDQATRASAYDFLNTWTNKSFAYFPEQNSTERFTALKKWNDWWDLEKDRFDLEKYHLDLMNSDPEKATASAEVLLAMNSTRAAPSLADFWRVNKAKLRKDLLKQFTLYFSTNHSAVNNKLIASGFVSDDLEIKRQTYAACADNPQAFLEQYRAGMNDSDPLVQASSIDALAFVKDESSLEQINSLLKSDAPEVRLSAARALFEKYNENVSPGSLAICLSSGEPPLVQQAEDLLDKMFSAENQTLAGFAGLDPEAQTLLTCYLVNHNLITPPRLDDLLSAKNSQVRLLGLYSCKLAGSITLPQRTKCANDPDSTIRLLTQIYFPAAK